MLKKKEPGIFYGQRPKWSRTVWLRMTALRSSVIGNKAASVSAGCDAVTRPDGRTGGVQICPTSSAVRSPADSY